MGLFWRAGNLLPASSSLGAGHALNDGTGSPYSIDEMTHESSPPAKRYMTPRSAEGGSDTRGALRKNPLARPVPAEYLGKGSHAIMAGWLRNNNHDRGGSKADDIAFTAEEIEYLDGHAESEAGGNGGPAPDGEKSGSADRPNAATAPRRQRKTRQPAHADA